MSDKTERRRNFFTGGVGRWSFPWFWELQSSAGFPTDLKLQCTCGFYLIMELIPKHSPWSDVKPNQVSPAK